MELGVMAPSTVLSIPTEQYRIKLRAIHNWLPPLSLRRKSLIIWEKFKLNGPPSPLRQRFEFGLLWPPPGSDETEGQRLTVPSFEVMPYSFPTRISALPMTQTLLALSEPEVSDPLFDTSRQGLITQAQFCLPSTPERTHLYFQMALPEDHDTVEFETAVLAGFCPISGSLAISHLCTIPHRWTWCLIFAPE